MDIVTFAAAKKAARSFGSAAAGKVAVVGADGVLTPETIAAGEVVIDDTLAIEGAAADAAATGAAIAAAAGGQVTVETPAAGSTFTLDPCPVTYSFGERAELTLTLTTTTQYHFMFTCPSSAATVLTTPSAKGRPSQWISLIAMMAPSGMMRMPIHLTRLLSERIISLCFGLPCRFASSVSLLA